MIDITRHSVGVTAIAVNVTTGDRMKHPALHIVLEAAQKKGHNVREVGFKGSIQALRQWEPHLNQGNINKQKRYRLMQLLYESIARNIVASRPGRAEPRAVKRRPKNYQLLTVPRHDMVELKHRNRNRAEEA